MGSPDQPNLSKDIDLITVLGSLASGVVNSSLTHKNYQ